MKIVLIMTKAFAYSYKNLPKLFQDADSLTIPMLYSIIKNAFPDIEVDFYDETV